MSSIDRPADLICLSHLRWNFVFQRPQHLMTRFARERRVYFFEEPIFDASSDAYLHLEQAGSVTVAVPHLPGGTAPAGAQALQRTMIHDLIQSQRMTEYLLWYYTPMALAFTDHLSPAAVIYDCMDELSAFKGAAPALREREAALLRAASLVLTGGRSLYEAKRSQHHNIHPFPSSVDVEHFSKARLPIADPADQASIPHPRLGFAGVIDERMDVDLIDAVAALRPLWQLVFVGPVVKIDPESLPRRSNIHYLGAKSYGDLPAYLAGWDVGLLPFARNEATRFISPTKTPEYLAAGLPAVSTSIRDVVNPYGRRGLVRIADDPGAFVDACEAAMADDVSKRTRRADAFLRRTSWDETWKRIDCHVRSLTRGSASHGDEGGVHEAPAL